MFDHRSHLKSITQANTVFKFKEITLQQTLKILQSTKSSKAAGFDALPARIIKDIASEFAAPLTFLINISLQSGIFPTAEKLAKINPVFKSGERTNVDNYRPMSVLNILSKTVERVVYNQLSENLESNNLLSDNQYGFRRYSMVFLVGRLNGSAAICSTGVKSLSTTEFCQTGSTSHTVFHKTRF